MIMILAGSVLPVFAGPLELVFRAGMGFSSLSSDVDASYDTGLNQVLNLEGYLYPFGGASSLANIGIGIGAGFRFTPVEDSSMGWIWTYNGLIEDGYMIFVPFYASFKYKMQKTTYFIPYLRMDHGYSLCYYSDAILEPYDGRSYYYEYWGGYMLGLGLGLEFDGPLVLELQYNLFNSGFNTEYRYMGIWHYYEENFTNHCLSLLIGLRF